MENCIVQNTITYGNRDCIPLSVAQYHLDYEDCTFIYCTGDILRHEENGGNQVSLS